MTYSNIRSCPSCGAQNRIPPKHLADTGRCGSCKAPLPPVSAPLEVDEAAFDEILREVPVPVFVDFWAAWCGPCRMAAPEVEALARELAGRAVILKVDTEAEPALADRFAIRSIPTFIVFENGRPVLQRSGLAPRAEMRRWIEQAAAAPASR
jgi:thioredoxin 2